MNTPLSLSSRAVVLSAATALLATVAKAAPPFDPHATTTTTMIQDDEEKEKEVVDELAEEWSSEKNGEEEEPFSDDDEGGLAKIDQSPDNKDEKADSIFMDSKQDDEDIAVDASEEFGEKLDEPIEDGTEPTAEAGDESFDEERVAEQEEEEEPLDILEEEGGEEPEQQQQEDEANETVKDNLDVNDDDSFGLGDDKETEITTDIFGDDKAEEEETALDAPEEATDEAIEDTTELKDEKLSDDLEEEEDQEDPEQQTNEEELPEIAEENIVDPEPSDEQLLDDGIEESEEPSIDSEQDSVKDFVDEVIEGSENDETKEQDGTFTGDGESAETDMPVEEAWDEDQNAEQESNEEEVQETSEDFPTQVIDMEDKTTEPDSLLDDQIDDDKKDTEVTVPGIVDEEKSSDFLPTSNDTKQDDDFLGAIQEIQDEETEQVVNDINESLEKALDAFQDDQEAPPFGAPSQEPPSIPSHDTTGFLLDENDTKQNDTSGSTLNVLLFIAVLALILLKLPKIKRLLSSRSSADQSLPYHSLRNKIRD